MNPKSIPIRTKKLGLILKDARTVANKSPDESAAAAGIPVEQYLSYEAGQQAPSLPELEALAFLLNVPLEHLLSSSILAKPEEATPLQKVTRLVHIRQRMIAARLKIARSESGFTEEEISAMAGIPVDQLKAYESGQTPIPFPYLELLAETYVKPLEDFTDQEGPVGQWRNQQRMVNAFLDLPGQLQEFICKPVNRPYMYLAIRLSDLSVEKLRLVAEGLLEITY
jgi:transcriptional regulator with XRE-family HTH domain